MRRQSRENHHGRQVHPFVNFLLELLTPTSAVVTYYLIEESFDVVGIFFTNSGTEVLE